MQLRAKEIATFRETPTDDILVSEDQDVALYQVEKSSFPFSLQGEFGKLVNTNDHDGYRSYQFDHGDQYTIVTFDKDKLPLKKVA
jgi:hypothetical protein